MKTITREIDFSLYFTDAPLPPRTDLAAVLQHWAVHRPDRVAFYFTDGEGEVISLTYSQLDAAARNVGGYLQKHGAAGQRVLLVYPPVLDFVVGFFGCLYAGATAVPAYPPRRNRKGQRIHGIAHDCQAQMALTTEHVRQQIEGDTNWVEWESISIIATDSLANDYKQHWTNPRIKPEDLAVLQYTSGSTGSPKGVMLTHGNLVRNTEMIMHAFDVRQNSRGVSWLPTYHDMGLVGGILMPVFSGCTLSLMSPMTFLQQPIRWLRTISKFQATISGAPNFAYQLCVDKIREEELEGIDLSSWQTAFNGAEPVRPSTLEQFAERFSKYGFNRRAFLPCYGMAETTLIVSGGPQHDEPLVACFDSRELEANRVVEAKRGEANTRELVGCGQILPGERVIVVHPDTRQILNSDQIGEIWVTSPSVGRGYWEKEEATRETFEALTADGAGPYLRTGDLGFIYKNQIFVAGRLKDMIIVRGVNRYPQDIEQTAELAHEALQGGLVAAFAINASDRERLIICAEVARKIGVDVNQVVQAIRRDVTQNHDLPPDAVFLVRNGTLPRTSSGKVQRHAAKIDYSEDKLKVIGSWKAWELDLPRSEPMIAASTGAVAAPANNSSAVAGHAFAAPDHEVVDIVMDAVRAVAQERAKELELDTNIVLDLGLDSLERMQIAHSLEQTFSGRFPEEVIQEIETIREISTAIETHLGKSRINRDMVPTQTGLKPTDSREIAPEEYRFDQLPEYRKLKRTMAQFALTGVPNPYFTVHEGLTRDTTRIDGRELISFASYNYIGMSGDPEVSAAVVDAVNKYGTSVSASRLVSGEKDLHGRLEREIAEWIGVDSAVVMVGGHATNETTIGHLVGPGDLIVHDSLSHNSIVQGAILSGARRRPFPHNDWQALESILAEVRASYRRILVVVEGVYSMDGDFPELPKFIDVKKRYKSWLMVDEAHSMGTMGKTGRGIGEHFGVDPRSVDIWMGTLSKSFGSCGGYIAGCNELTEYLRYTAPGFVFSVGLSPPNAAASLASLKVLREHPERIATLQHNAALFLSEAKKRGLNTGESGQTAVIPVITGNSLHALLLSRKLFEKGINVQPILYPAVEESAARLRFFINSTHSEEQIRYTVSATADSLAEVLRTAT